MIPNNLNGLIPDRPDWKSFAVCISVVVLGIVLNLIFGEYDLKGNRR